MLLPGASGADRVDLVRGDVHGAVASDRGHLLETRGAGIRVPLDAAVRAQRVDAGYDLSAPAIGADGTLYSPDNGCISALAGGFRVVAQAKAPLIEQTSASQPRKRRTGRTRGDPARRIKSTRLACRQRARHSRHQAIGHPEVNAGVTGCNE